MNLMELWKMNIIRIDNLILNADNITLIGRPDEKYCIRIFGVGIEEGLDINYPTPEQRDKDFHKLAYLLSEL